MGTQRTPEQLARRREYQRSYRAQNREKLAEYYRNRVRVFTPEQKEANRIRSRAYYAANREKSLARSREYQIQNRDKISAQTRSYRAKNPDKIRAAPSRSTTAQLRRRHGMWPEDWAASWEAQGGRCYLCSNALIAEKAHIDHDHSCCGPDRSCPVCRRGLSCEQCNRAIGLADDDPDRLHRMADALAVAKRGVAARMADREATGQALLL